MHSRAHAPPDFSVVITFHHTHCPTVPPFQFCCIISRNREREQLKVGGYLYLEAPPLLAIENEQTLNHLCLPPHWTTQTQAGKETLLLLQPVTTKGQWMDRESVCFREVWSYKVTPKSKAHRLHLLGPFVTILAWDTGTVLCLSDRAENNTSPSCHYFLLLFLLGDFVIEFVCFKNHAFEQNVISIKSLGMTPTHCSDACLSPYF